MVDLCDNNFKRRKEHSKDRKKRCDALTDDEIQKVQNFYLREDISRMLPGKKDYVSVKLADGKREHRQKRLLLKLEKCMTFSRKKAMFRLANPSLQNSGHPRSYHHLQLTMKYVFVSIMKILTFSFRAYQDLAHLAAYQVKKLLQRQYVVLTLANALTGFAIAVG